MIMIKNDLRGVKDDIHVSRRVLSIQKIEQEKS